VSGKESVSGTGSSIKGRERGNKFNMKSKSGTQSMCPDMRLTTAHHLPRINITCGETSNLSTVRALQVNVILLKIIYGSYKKIYRLL